eukprot:960494_1
MPRSPMPRDKSKTRGFWKDNLVVMIMLALVCVAVVATMAHKLSDSTSADQDGKHTVDAAQPSYTEEPKEDVVQPNVNDFHKADDTVARVDQPTKLLDDRLLAGFVRDTGLLIPAELLAEIEMFHKQLCGLTVWVRTMTGHTIALEVESGDVSIKAVKDMIYNETGTTNQRLVFQGKGLEDNHTLKSYKIENKNTIHMVHRE